jgi:acylphosphatase
MVRKRVVLGGRVQGVSFRWATQQLARQHGVAGWVRNCPDGSVEAVFEGEEAEVERMLAFCRAGPPGASVARVEVTDEEPERLAGFRIAG